MNIPRYMYLNRSLNVIIYFFSKESHRQRYFYHSTNSVSVVRPTVLLLLPKFLFDVSFKSISCSYIIAWLLPWWFPIRSCWYCTCTYKRS